MVGFMDDIPIPNPLLQVANKLNLNKQHSSTFIWADSEEVVILIKQHRCNSDHCVAFGEIIWMNET